MLTYNRNEKEATVNIEFRRIIINKIQIKTVFFGGLWSNDTLKRSVIASGNIKIG